MSAPETPGVAGPPSDGAVLAIAVAAAGGLAAFEIGSLAARDGLFLSQLPASQLPAVMLGAAVVSLAATLGLSRWMQRTRPDRVAPLALLFSALVFVAMGYCSIEAPTLAAVLLYLQVTGIAPVVASSFWSVVNERFDPYEAKRVVARMAAAGALGGVGGGLLAERLATWTGIPTLLFALAAIAAACAWAVRAIGARPGAAPDGGRAHEGDSGLALMRRIALLRQMAVLMLLVAAVETLVEYALKVEAARSFDDDASLVRFFAVFYTSCGLLSFAIQSLAGDRFLRRFGLAGAVAMLPGSVALLGAPATVIAKLWTVALARGAENVASIAFFRAGFQLLYTPMATAVKRPAKVWVDVAAGSAGDMLGAGLVLGLLFAAPELPTQAVMIVAVAGALAALAIVRRVHKGYVRELTDSLRRGRVEIREEDALDRTTLQTIVHSHTSFSRTSLLEKVRAFDAASSGPSDAAAADSGSETERVPERRPEAGDDPSITWIGTLLSRDDEAIRSALAGGIDATPGATPARRRRVVAWVIPLLARDPLARAARNFLRPLASRVVGQLVDALLDPDLEPAARTRVAWILGGLDDGRAATGLWQACRDESFALRSAAARALARMTARRPELAPTVEAVHEAVLAEVETDAELWSRRRSRRDDHVGEGSVLLGRQAISGVSGSLEHVFTLLAIVHDRELVASALAGLAGNDPALRGTALELLESVLTPGLRRALWPRLDAPAASGPPGRSRAQIESELLESTVGQVIDRDALKGD